MFETRRKLDEIINIGVTSKTFNFIGVIVDYDPKERTCVIKCPHPNSAGDLTLLDRLLPDVTPGIKFNRPPIGYAALLSAPGGRVDKAFITAIQPGNFSYSSLERREMKRVPRFSGLTMRGLISRGF